MRLPNEGTAPLRLYNTWGLYLTARLEAHPQTQGLRESWGGVQAALREATAGTEAAWERRMMARAVLDYADLVLDEAVRSVAAAVKGDLDGDVKRPEYERVFRSTPSEIVALPLRAEAEVVARIESELSGRGPWEAARKLVPDLRAAREGLEKAFDGYRAARLSHRDALDQVDDAVTDWRHACRGTYGALIEKFPADKRLQESFFYRAEERDRGDEDDPASLMPAACAAGATSADA